MSLAYLHDLPPAFWGVATLGLYGLARLIYARKRRWWSSPLLLAWLACLALAFTLQVSYADYLRGTSWLLSLLGPATVAFALPIYEQRQFIRRHWPVLAVGVMAGSTIAIFSSWLLAKSFGLPPDLERSLVPHSITTPFAMTVASGIGGIPQIAAVSTAVTGLLGAVIGDGLLKYLPVRSAFARGSLFGMGAHGVGVAKAYELGQEEGSIAGLVMILAGLANVAAAPVIAAVLI
ncbi:MAG: LrgB family protein [Rhodospirillaceae bacterium]|nr:MAG: LrgB family protein [Rhodospirillaceae bacterium]